MPLRRAVKWALLAAAAVILIALGALLTAPWWVNQELVRQRIVDALARATGGTAQYRRLDLQFFPLPGAVMQDLRLSVPGVLELRAKDAAVEVSAVRLLLGEARLRHLRVTAPEVLLQLSDRGKEPLTIAQTQERLREALNELLRIAPNLTGVIEGGSIEVRRGGRSELRARNAQLTIRTSHHDVDVALSCAGDLWREMTLTARLGPADLAGTGQLKVQGLQMQALGAWVGAEASWPLAQGLADAQAIWTMRGLTNVDAKLSASAPTVAVKIADQPLSLGALAIDARVRLVDGAVQLTVGRLSLQSPQAMLTGTLDVNDAGVALDLHVQNTDLAALQKTLDDLAPHAPVLARLPLRAEAGAIEALQIRAAAADFESLANWGALQANARVTAAQLLLPEYALRMHDVSGQLSLRDGTLALEQVDARLTKSRLRAGRATFRPGVAPMPLHVEAMLDTDLAEALSVLRTVLRTPDVRRELGRIKQLQGSAQVALVLEGAVGDLRLQVDASGIRASGRHAAVPVALRIDDGRIRYRDSVLAWEGARGAVGTSTVSRASGSLGVRHPFALRAGRTDAVLVVDEIFRWLDHYPEIERQLDVGLAVSGSAAMSVESFEADLDELQRLSFRASVSPKQLVVEPRQQVPKLVLNGGSIALSERALQLQSVGVSLLDAALTVSAQAQNYRAGISAVSGSVTGTLGPQAMRWVYDRTEYPKGWWVNAPVKLNSGEFDWQAHRATSARGIVAFASGPQVGFAVRTAGDELEAFSFHVRDAVSDARFSARTGERTQASFQGFLAGTTVDAVFEDPRVVIGELRGDLRAEVDVDRPSRSKVTGALRGTAIPAPYDLPLPLTIERFSVRAQGDALVVESATLTSGEDRVDLSGDIERAADGYQIDVDLRGDSVTLPESLFAGKDQGESASTARPLGRWWKVFKIPVHGRVSVALARLRVGRFEIAPLKGSGIHSDGRIDLNITQAALCGVSLVGEVTAKPWDIAVQATLSARNAPLSQSIYCLSDKRVQATGEFDLQMSVASRGRAKQLWDNLRGDYTLTARDGRIQKFDTLAKILAFVNLTQVVSGAIKIDGAEGIAYHSYTSQGTIEGRNLIIDHAVLDADRMTIVGTARINYEDGSVQASVVVAPIKFVTAIFSKIPIVSRIFGGTLIAIPVRVTGTLDNPSIVPLSPGAIASQLTKIIGNTLKLPFELFSATPAPGSQPPPSPKAP